MLILNSTEPGVDLVSIPYFDSLYILFVYVVWPSVTAVGVVTNLINVIVFCKMGVRNSVDISFMALSVSNFGFLVVSLSHSICGALMRYPGTLELDPYSLLMVLYWYSYAFYDVTVLMTAFIAVARCCCVSIPLYFKGVFSNFRTILIVVFIFVSILLIRLPMWMVQRLSWVVDPYNNRSRLLLTVVGDRQLAVNINDIFNRNILPWSSFVVVILCSSVLTKSLVDSSKFRKSSKVELNPPGSETKANISAKSAKVIKSVILVSVLFVAQVVPTACHAVARAVVPQYTDTGRYKDVYTLVSFVTNTACYLHSSVGISIYRTYNTRYRVTLALMCARVDHYTLESDTHTREK